MPPRRATRAASAAPSSSADSPPSKSSKSTTSKRKRAVVAEEPSEDEDNQSHMDEDDEDEQTVTARKTSSRRSSVQPTSRARSSRATKNVEPVVDEDSDDMPSPPKRSKKKSAVDSDDEDDWEEQPRPVAKGRRSSVQPRGKGSSRSAGRASKAADRETIDEEDEEDDIAKQSTSRSKGRASNKSSKARPVIKEELDDEHQLELTPKRTSSSTSSLTESEAPSQTDDQPTPRPNRSHPRVEDSDEAEELETDAQLSVDAGGQDKAQMPIEEPEHSLLDDSNTTHSKLPASQIPEEPQGPRSRLVIHKMSLINFKSYAGRQDIGPFHKSFSAIVGPNGSGKSNTIDALLFVFGYRASKMRQGKLSELIHNSARYPDLDECSVEVHFREIVDLPGPDAYEVVPNSQLVVARTAYKSNSSKYTINGRTSSFTEVTTLLKGRGIDLDHKRFLILQGEVESIAQMKPKAPSEHEDGLLEYLEDIIGTSKYKEPIDEALVELDKFAEVRAEKLNRLRIVEREKNALEDKKREAEDFLRLQNDHVRALSRWYQWNLWQCLMTDEKLVNVIEALETELAEETERNKDDITHCELLEKHFEERGAAYEEVKAAAAEAVKDLAVHEKQQVNLEERKKHANGKGKKLKKSVQEDSKARDEALRFIETNSEKIEKEKKKHAEQESSLEKEEKVLEGIRDSLKDKTQVFHDQIEVKQKELQPWTAKINTKKAEVDVAVSERDTLAKKAEAVKNSLNEAQESLANLQGDHDAKTAELLELKENRGSLKEDVRAGEKKQQDMQKKIEELRGKASSSRQKAEEAKASQAASTSQGKVLDSLTKLRDTGRISGFHGRLGNLGTIAEKYDVAISTACPALNNLIVDSVEQGQACIEYLRKQSVGRASFIVLEKLSPTNGLEKITTPENVPRLFDLIQPKDPRFAPAFFKAVGNTLVANDLEQANRIAFGQRRWRVVTLTGQLIDTSGTMSGGGTHVAKGAMSSKIQDTVQPEVLRRYEKESEDASKKLDAALAEFKDFETQFDGRTKRIPQIDMAIQKVELDIQTGAKRIAEAERRVRDLKSQSKPDAGDQARIATLEKEIAASTKELDRLHKDSGAIEKAIQDLEKKILDIGGAKLLSQKSKVDGIKLHITLALDEITKAEVNKAKAEKDSVKFEKAVEANKVQLEEVEAELEELNDQLKECNQFVAELQSKVEAAQAAAENAKDDLETLKTELDEKTAQIQKFRQREMEIQQKLGEAKKDSADNEKNMDRYRTQHDNLKLEEIDDDDDEEGDGDVQEPVEQSETEQEGEPRDPAEASAKKPHASSSAFELQEYTNEELARFKKKELLADVALLDEQVKNANPNLGVLKEYRKREQEFLNRAKDLEQVTSQRDAQKAKYDGLRKQRLDEFMSGFTTISMKLKEMYQMITLGGNAELELVDSMDPFSEGIIFSVMPPKKSWKNISNLSGGEKVRTGHFLALAYQPNPTPLYFMDEIDAALDFRNVSIVANYIKDRTKNAQFIIISLRNDMFELSHRLIGIYKTSNATRSISIDNRPLTALPMNTVRA
ncbi:hypothetical protein BD410DRAFT_783474 [Rickenella mellea]|uniref:Structural maintenance of chromosomes protein 4 n=1 Tax=Rickenella mellea TaxID=50990 RepID=A0A4Y7QGV2_9AGAM|nr:hypothetical protein BD410DRAFT_783474 [Rickenella mellea]